MPPEIPKTKEQPRSPKDIFLNRVWQMEPKQRVDVIFTKIRPFFYLQSWRAEDRGLLGLDVDQMKAQLEQACQVEDFHQFTKRLEDSLTPLRQFKAESPQELKKTMADYHKQRYDWILNRMLNHSFVTEATNQKRAEAVRFIEELEKEFHCQIIYIPAGSIAAGMAIRGSESEAESDFDGIFLSDDKEKEIQERVDSNKDYKDIKVFNYSLFALICMQEHYYTGNLFSPTMHEFEPFENQGKKDQIDKLRRYFLIQRLDYPKRENIILWKSVIRDMDFFKNYEKIIDSDWVNTSVLKGAERVKKAFREKLIRKYGDKEPNPKFITRAQAVLAKKREKFPFPTFDEMLMAYDLKEPEEILEELL
jgi:hypothetical protein